MENNFAPENTQFPNNTYPNNTYPGNAPYPANNTPQQPVQTAPQYANPYGAQAPETPQYANPYGAQTPEAPQYADPYAPQYADPYAPQYANPYGTPVTPPAKKSKKGLLIGLIAGGSALLIIIIALVLYFTSDSYKYGKAEDLMAEGNYTEALAMFDELGYYEDSEDKVIECNKNILYEELEGKEDGVYIYSGDYKYILEASEDEKALKLWVLTEDSGFCITFYMDSDDADFYYLWDSSYGSDSTTEGTCKISELTTDNSLEIDKFTGSTSYMQSLTDSNCDLACLYLPDLLEETYLGLTPADIGFTSLD